MVFAYASQGVISNSTSALCIHGTDKVEIGDWIEISGYKGEVVGFFPLYVQIRDESGGLDHVRIIDIPNTYFIQFPMVHYIGGQYSIDNHPSAPAPVVSGAGGSNRRFIPNTLIPTGV